LLVSGLLLLFAFLSNTLEQRNKKLAQHAMICKVLEFANIPTTSETMWANHISNS